MNPNLTSIGLYCLEIFGPEVRAGFSGRNFGNADRKKFLSELDLELDNLVMVKQVHGSSVCMIENIDSGHIETPADGLITDKHGIVLGVRTADCVPVFFHDTVKNVVGIAHGGWKGVREGIIEKMVETFEARFGSRPEDLTVAIGPSIRKCCYEVGKEFHGYFQGFYEPMSELKGKLDLVGAVQDKLFKLGIRKKRLQDTELCTVCHNDLFYSYRVERQTKERILNVISLVG